MLHVLPVQVLQYELRSMHHSANPKHWRASGHEFVEKQSATWSKQEDTALPQDVLSLKKGSGLEHHFPLAYSQVGAGAMDVHGVTFMMVEEEATERVMLIGGVIVESTWGVAVVDEETT